MAEVTTTTTSSSEEFVQEEEQVLQGNEVDEEKVEKKEEKVIEKVKFSVNFKKQVFAIEMGWDQTVGDLRQEVAKLSGVPAALQKLMLKGLLKNDNDTLRNAGFSDGAKVMLIGSTIQDVMSTAALPPSKDEASSSSVAEKEHLSEKLPHKKIIEKGKPEKIMPGLKHRNESLPDFPLEGILNNRGDSVRLTFKVFTQELWIASKSNTQKLPFMSIRGVSSVPIKDNEEYHIVTLQLGSGEAQKYYLYWVPAQYSRAIANTIMTDYSAGY